MTGESRAYVERKQRRRRAHRVMRVVSVICALAALGLGAYELHSEGLAQFLYRAPGVGASPSNAQGSPNQ